MRRTFKEFIISWYYFLKVEYWVLIAFGIIVVTIFSAGRFIAVRRSFAKYGVYEIHDIIKHASSFEVIAEKLHSHFEEESKKHDNLTSFLVSQTKESLIIYFKNNDKFLEESITLQLTKSEKKSLQNIVDKTLTGTGFFYAGRYLEYIYVYEDRVIFSMSVNYSIYWFPSDKIAKGIINDITSTNDCHFGKPSFFHKLYIRMRN